MGGWESWMLRLLQLLWDQCHLGDSVSTWSNGTNECREPGAHSEVVHVMVVAVFGSQSDCQTYCVTMM
jgi:hypothetical protein